MFKKIISFAVSCVIAVSCAATCFAETKMEIVKKDLTAPQKLVFVGDSIAAGVGLDGYNGTGSNPPSCYASILKEKYFKEIDGACEFIMKNEAVSGDTSSDLLEKLQSGSLDASIYGSNAVVISIGGNDIMGPALDFLTQDLNIKSEQDVKNFDTSTLASPATLAKINDKLNIISENLSRFKSNLENIISTIRAKSNGVIIFQTVYNPLDSNKSIAILSETIGGKINELNNIIINGAKDENGNERYLVCDVFSAFAGKSKEYTNINKYDIHPNAEGHKVISELVDKQIKTQKYTFEELVEVKDSPKQKMSTTKIYVTVGLFFGGFFILFAFVWIKFKRSQ